MQDIELTNDRLAKLTLLEVFDNTSPQDLPRTPAAAHSQTTNKTPKSFLDLPAEIRNTIYELCLITDTPYEAQIRLLAVNKQIREEGSGIMYNSNHEFEVRIYPDGVLVQKHQFSEYLALSSESRSIMKLLWPSWLKQVKFLRLILVDRRENRLNERRWAMMHTSAGGLSQLKSVLYSLSSFLQEESQLECPSIRTGAADGSRFVRDAVVRSKVLYPLTMLSTLPAFSMNSQGIEVLNLPESTHMSFFNLYWPTAERAEKSKALFGALRYLRQSNAASSSSRNRTESIESNVKQMEVMLALEYDESIDEEWEKCFGSYVVAIEKAYNQTHFERIRKSVGLWNNQLNRVVREVQSLLE